MRRSRSDEDLPMSGVPSVDDDVKRELDFHVERRVAELIELGRTPAEARAEATEYFGDRSTVEAECREIESRRRTVKRRARLWSDLRQDAKMGVALLRKRPGFTAMAMATLAVGIGATTAMFSLVYQVLLRPLPYAEPEQLVDVLELHDKGGWGNIPYANFLDLVRDARLFTALAAHGASMETVLGADTPLRVTAATITRDFFKVFPVTPVLGRLPLAEEHALGAAPVAVVSYTFWRDHLGAPRSLNGVRIRLGFDHEVVGVLPQGFGFPGEAHVWTPLELWRQSMSRTSHNREVTGRLRPGVDAVAAQAEVDQLLSRYAQQYAGDFDATGSRVTSLQAELTQGSIRPLYLLLGAAGLVLLTACCNLAGAMLARGTSRASELAVRTALGATRARIVRQLLAEAAVLAVAGGVIGVALGYVILRVVSAAFPVPLGSVQVQMEAPVLGFAALIVMATVLLFGLIPAVRLSAGQHTASRLRDGQRSTVDRGRIGAWRVLVAGEVALAVTLLVGASLLMQSLRNVLANDLGFDPDGVMMAEVSLPSSLYAGDSPDVAAFHVRVAEAMARVPGADAAGFANVLPLNGSGPNGAMIVEGKPMNASGEYNGSAVYRVVGGEFFKAAGTAVLRGRTFSSSDDALAPPVVVVNEEMARLQWPNEDPIGKRVRPYGMDGREEPWATVIGVVANVRSNSPTDRARETYYFDHRQRPAYRTQDVTWLLRSELAPAIAAKAMRDAISTADARVPVETRVMNTMLSGAVADRQFIVQLLTAFAAVALLLSVLGIFAVVSYSVLQRASEMGIRLALGSTPDRLRLLVVRDALLMVLPGLLLGAGMAMALGGAVRSLVYGVDAIDPLSIMAAVLALALATLAASYAPARRASGTNPMQVIRSA